MNLKEAFRYQNKLQSFLDDAQSILDRDSNVTRGENTYLRHKVMAEAEDEAVLAVPEKDGMVSKRVPLAIKTADFLMKSAVFLYFFDVIKKQADFICNKVCNKMDFSFILNGFRPMPYYHVCSRTPAKADPRTERAVRLRSASVLRLADR